MKITVKKGFNTGNKLKEAAELPKSIMKSPGATRRSVPTVPITARKLALSNSKQFAIYKNTKITIPKTHRGESAGSNLLKMSIENKRGELNDYLEKISDQNRGIVKMKQVVTRLKSIHNPGNR